MIDYANFLSFFGIVFAVQTFWEETFMKTLRESEYSLGLEISSFKKMWCVGLFSNFLTIIFLIFIAFNKTESVFSVFSVIFGGLTIAVVTYQMFISINRYYQLPEIRVESLLEDERFSI